MRTRRPGAPGNDEAKDGSGSREGERGQTTIDFAVGASVFLIVVAFVFMFVPGMYQPFTGTGTNALVANRVADQLSNDLLGSPGQPAVLNTTCTVEFFDGDGSVGTCRYSHDDAHLRRAFNLSAGTSVNVTVESSSGIATANAPGQSETTLAAGEAPSNARSVTSAERVVLLNGTTYRMHVRVW